LSFWRRFGTTNPMDDVTKNPVKKFLSHVAACAGCADYQDVGGGLCEEGFVLREAVPFWEVSVSSELVRDTTPVECDDGELRTKEVFFVTATSQEGAVYSHEVVFEEDDVERAEKLAERVRGAAGWEGPVGNPRWRFYRVVYCSSLYSRNQDYLEAETELLDRASDLGSEAAYRSLPDGMKVALGNEWVP